MTEHPSRLRCFSRRLIESATVSVPAVRLVAVYAWWEETEQQAKHDVLPIVGLRTCVFHEYSIEAPRFCPPPCHSHEGYLRKGWKYDGQDCETECLIVGEVGVESLDDAFLGVSACLEPEIVAAPWPQEEDEVRLAPVIEHKKQAVMSWQMRQESLQPPAPESLVTPGEWAEEDSDEDESTF